MLVRTELLTCPACLELMEVGLLCDVIATKLSVSVALLHLATPPDVSAAHLAAFPTCPASPFPQQRSQTGSLQASPIVVGWSVF